MATLVISRKFSTYHTAQSVDAAEPYGMVDPPGYVGTLVTIRCIVACVARMLAGALKTGTPAPTALSESKLHALVKHSVRLWGSHGVVILWGHGYTLTDDEKRDCLERAEKIAVDTHPQLKLSPSFFRADALLAIADVADEIGAAVGTDGATVLAECEIAVMAMDLNLDSMLGGGAMPLETVPPSVDAAGPTAGDLERGEIERGERAPDDHPATDAETSDVALRELSDAIHADIADASGDAPASWERAAETKSTKRKRDRS